MKKYLILTYLLLHSYCSYAYTPPVGIPAPTWGIDETIPARPNPWTSDVAGYYYVDNTAGTDSGRTYGNPTAPRKTVPATLSKGAYLEINGNYGADSVTGSGTGEAWSANSDGPIWITCASASKANCTITGKFEVYGSYVYLDNLSVSSKIQTGSTTESESLAVDHVMIRNCDVYGDNTTTVQGGIAVLGSDNATPVNTTVNVIVYNNTVHNFGDMDQTTDVDTGSVVAGNGAVSYVWLLENTVSYISNSSMFAGGQSGSDPSLCHHIYFGKNTIHDVNVVAIGIKNITNAIISENVVYNINPEGWSPGKCFGAQYDFNELWLINNTCYHAPWGLRTGDDAGAGPHNLYIIGNLFYDISWEYHCNYTAVSDSWCRHDDHEEDQIYNTGVVHTEGAIVLDGGTNNYIINNTFYDVSSGILSNQPNHYIENNIIVTANDGGWHVWLNSPGDNDTLRNNIFYQPAGTWQVRWGASTDYNTLAALYAAKGWCDPTYCKATDPQLVNPTTSFALQSSSPAVGAALAAASLTTDVFALFTTNYSLDIAKDIAGTTRPQQTTWDIGAYEYTPGALKGISTGSGSLNMR